MSGLTGLDDALASVRASMTRSDRFLPGSTANAALEAQP